MRILVLSNFGMGLYKFRRELVQELIKLGHQVFVSLPNDEYVPMLEKLGCIYIESKVDRRGKNPITDIKLLFSYVKIIKENNPDIVLTYTVKPNVYGGIACRITRKKYLANVTGLGTAIENKGLLQRITLRLYKVGLKNAACIFFQNKTNKQFFTEKGIVRTNMKVIPGSGVNLKQHSFEEYPCLKDNIKFLYVGRIMKAKGIDELLEAVKQIKSENCNIEFHFVGFCEEAYMKQLNELNTSKIICFHGQQDNIHQFMKNSHVIILPSYHEGTSNVLLEAASTGRPILASNVPGCKETFEEGISGFGFEPRNIEELVKTIQKFIKIPYEDKIKMGVAARKKVECEYDRNIVINEYLKEICNKRRNQNEFV